MIKRLSKGKHLLDIRVDKRRLRQHFPTRQEAADYESEIRAQARRTKFNFPADAAKLTFKEACDTYLAEIKRRGRDETYTRRYELIFERIQKILSGDLHLVRINSRDLETYVNQRLDAGVTRSTIDRELTMLMACFNYAKEFYNLMAWQMPKKPKLGSFSGRKRVISRDEEKKILAALDPANSQTKRERKEKQQLSDIFQLALLTGMRLQEILKLTWSEVVFEQTVRFKHGYIQLPAHRIKTRTGRIIPLSSPAKKLLKRIKQENQYIFPSVYYPGKPREAITKLFKTAVTLAGLPYGKSKPNGIIFHDTRHTAATRMLQAGADIRTIMEVLGHTSATTALGYTHGSAESMQRAVNALGVRLVSTKARKSASRGKQENIGKSE